MQRYNLFYNRFRSLLLMFSILFLACQVFASEQELQKDNDTNIIVRKSSGPYCGLYCLYTIIRLSGQEINFADLVKPEYIGSRRGSSLAELKKAAEDCGLYTVAAGKLTSRELLQLNYPVILHVKYGIGSSQYDHYELFLGTENNQARLFDPPNPVKLVTFHELAPRWNGNGLVVSAEPIDTAALFAPARKRFIFYSAVVIAVILLIHLSRRWLPESLLNSRSKLLGLSIGQAAGFAVLALIIGMLFHFANDEGLLANANATASIQKAHAGNFITKISEMKVQKLLDTDTVFIDARRARDYKRGHLEGAISIPVDSNDIELKKATADIAEDARVVLYCQSAGCKYAEIVAVKLKDEGFSNISIYKGGWAEWAAKNGRKKGEQS